MAKIRRDVLLRQIREAIAEDNRKEIIERLWKGRQERVRKGHFPGGNAPYGYSITSKDLVPNPVEVEIIQEIIDRSRQGSLYSANHRSVERPWGKTQKWRDMDREAGSSHPVAKRSIRMRKNPLWRCKWTE